MANKTKAEIEQQIENEKARLEKLRKQLKAKEKAENEINRKKRNHRLIQVGGIVEKYCDEITDLEGFEEYIKKYSYAIKKALNNTTTETDGVSVQDTFYRPDHVASVEGVSTEGVNSYLI